MIAVSSFRPLGQNPEWDRNQLAAKASWDKVFTDVIYLNNHEEKLNTGTTCFLPTDTHPPIRELCRICAMAPGWACIINADIIVHPRLRVAESRAIQINALGLTSYRWQRQGDQYRVIDNGLDFFAAHFAFWTQVARACPPQLRIGHPTWDTWMIGYFNQHAPGRFFNITRYQCIMHPKHSDRRVIHQCDGALDGLKWYCGMPPRLS